MTICECELCATPLPPPTNGSRGLRRFCSDACRKRAARAPRAAPAGLPDGPVTTAVKAALAEVADFDGIDSARAELAIALSRLVDDAGSVPAARELRGLLGDMGAMVDEDIAAFQRSIQTPRYPTDSDPPC